MKNLTQNKNSTFSKTSKEKAIAPRIVDPEIDKPDKQPGLIIKDPSAIKDPSTSKIAIGDLSHAGDIKQPLNEDKGSPPSKVAGDRKPAMSDSEKTKDSDSGDGLYGSKQPITGDKQESTGAVGAQLGGASGTGISFGEPTVPLGAPLGLLGPAPRGLPLRLAGAPLGLLGPAPGGLPSGLAGAQLGALSPAPKGTSALAGAQLGGASGQPGIISGATLVIVDAALASVQMTGGGGAAHTPASGGSTEHNPLYTSAKSFNTNQKLFDASDALIGTNSIGSLDSLTNYELLDPLSSPSSLTINPGGNGVLTDPNPILNPPSSFTYIPNLGESTGSIVPLTGIGSSGGTILLSHSLPGSILTVSGLDSGMSIG